MDKALNLYVNLWLGKYLEATYPDKWDLEDKAMRFAQCSSNKLARRIQSWIQSMLIRMEPKIQSKLCVTVALVQSKACQPEVTWPNERVHARGPCFGGASMKGKFCLVSLANMQNQWLRSRRGGYCFMTSSKHARSLCSNEGCNQNLHWRGPHAPNQRCVHEV